MTKVRGVTGGGYDGRNVVHSQNGQKREPIVTAISPGGVSRIGSMVGTGTPYKSLVQGKGYTPPAPKPQAPGPGGGREVMPSGSQGKH